MHQKTPVIRTSNENMRQDYEQLFSHVTPPEPAGDLLSKVMSRIAQERRLLTVKKRIVLLSIGLLASVAAFVSAFGVARSGIAESGFGEFLSLLATDAGTVALYWQNFVLTLLESMPIVSIAATLTAVFAFLASLKYLVRELQHMPSHAPSGARQGTLA